MKRNMMYPNEFSSNLFILAQGFDNICPTVADLQADYDSAPDTCTPPANSCCDKACAQALLTAAETACETEKQNCMYSADYIYNSWQAIGRNFLF